MRTAVAIEIEGLDEKAHIANKFLNGDDGIAHSSKKTVGGSLYKSTDDEVTEQETREMWLKLMI